MYFVGWRVIVRRKLRSRSSLPVDDRCSESVTESCPAALSESASLVMVRTSPLSPTNKRLCAYLKVTFWKFTLLFDFIYSNPYSEGAKDGGADTFL